MKPYIPLPEMQWKDDPAIAEARKHPDWQFIQSSAAMEDIYFDHPEKDGRVGFKIVAYTVDSKLAAWEKCVGRGKTPLLALQAAYKDASL